jgi:hypothetical protein
MGTLCCKVIPYYIIAGFSQLIMVPSGIGYWLRNKALYVSLAVFLWGFIVWALIGFPILEGTMSIVTNCITKIAALSITTSVHLKH